MHRTFIYLLFIKIILFSTYVNAQSFTDSLQQKSYENLEEIYFKLLNKDTVKTKKIVFEYLRRAKKDRDTSKIIQGFLNYYNLNPIKYACLIKSLN